MSSCFELYIRYHYVNPCPVSPASYVCGDSLLAVCLSRQDGDIDRPPEYCKASDGLKKEASVKANC